MCKNWKMCEKSGRGRPGRGVVLEIRTHPDKGRGVVWKSEILADVLCRRPLKMLNIINNIASIVEVNFKFPTFLIPALSGLMWNTVVEQLRLKQQRCVEFTNDITRKEQNRKQISNIL